MVILKADNANASTCAILGLVLLIPGLLGPFMVIATMGHTEQYSIIELIIRLGSEGQWPLLAVVATFSLLFPLAKLLFLVILTTRILPLSPELCKKLYHITEKTARFSMVDVMVIALLVVALKVEGVASVTIAWGTVCFFLSVVFSLFSGLLVDVTRFEPAVTHNASP